MTRRPGAGLRVAALFARAGYEAPVAPEIRQEAWNKLAFYVGVAPTAALTHCTLDRLVADPAAHGLMAILTPRDELGWTFNP